MKLVLIIVLVGVIFLAGCTIQQTDNITQNEFYEQNETQNKTVELPKEMVAEDIFEKLCNQQNIFNDVIISSQRDCIIINVSDSSTKHSIQNATIELKTIRACPLSEQFSCYPELVFRGQTSESGILALYRDDVIDKVSIPVSIEINANGYDTLIRDFRYNFNQILSFELTAGYNLKYCNEDSDCIKVDGGCCGCESDGKLISINKIYEDYWTQTKSSKECKGCALTVISTDISCYARSRCTDNICILDFANFTVCENLQSWDNDWCYYRFAVQNKNIALCEKIKSNEIMVTPSKSTCKKSLS